MFNVSALLLDDALKPATPLTNGMINETLQHTLDISQGSLVTHLRCSEIFSDNIIFSWFLNQNNLENRLIFDKVKAYKKWFQFFWATLYMCCLVEEKMVLFV